MLNNIFGAALPVEIFQGYLLWATPLVSLLDRPVFRHILRLFKPWSKAMADSVSGKQPSFIGTYMVISTIALSNVCSKLAVNKYLKRA